MSLMYVMDVVKSEYISDVQLNKYIITIEIGWVKEEVSFRPLVFLEISLYLNTSKNKNTKIPHIARTSRG